MKFPSLKPSLSLAAAAMAPPATLPPGTDWHSTDPWIRAGYRTVVWLVGGLLVFSWLFSISGAVVATGTVTVESNYKTVQHLDGGIISKILVRNGDRVKEGDVLLRLEPTPTKAALAVTMSRLNDQLVQQARLEAERDRRETFTLPAVIESNRSDPAIDKIVTTQRALFEARKASRMGEQSVLKQRLDQLSEENSGLQAQLSSKLREFNLTAKELAAVQPLYDKGYANQQRLGGLQREHARLEGEVSRLKSDTARTQSAIAEAQLKMVQSEKEFTQSVVDELRKVQAAIAEIDETRKAQSDKVERIEIRAPRSGRVHALQAHTEGGVIEAAKPIAQIIPDGEKLLIEAQIPPQEIDKVRRDMTASVRFPAFDAKATPKLTGRVLQVSAAQLNDPQGRPYFTAQIEIPVAELRKIPSGHELVPGMPAEVYIETVTRSILSYFLKPLGDMSVRAMREN
jgi:HlyD family secretion protein